MARADRMHQPPVRQQRLNRLNRAAVFPTEDPPTSSTKPPPCAAAATLTRTPNSAGSTYNALVREGEPVGIASLRARQAIAGDEGDPTWLAYTFYGSRSASVIHNPTTYPRNSP